MERFSAAPRIGSNVAGSYETRQSGLPDVASQSLDDGAKSGSPPSGRSKHYQRSSKQSVTVRPQLNYRTVINVKKF